MSGDQSTPKLQLVEKPDPFDPTILRLEPTFDAIGVKKLILSVPVKRPNKQDFIRCHPDPAYRVNCGLIELSEDREVYLVPPVVAREFPGEVVNATLVTTITRQGAVFLWPV